MTTDFKDLGNKALHAVQYGETLRPARDWFVLLTISFFLILASAAWNAWVFLEVRDRDRALVDTNQSGGNTEDTVRSIETLFMEREAEAARYRSEYEFVDPS